MASVTLRNVRKSFGATEILRDLSLEIRDGEFMTLVGPSGCGKTTLLRIIAGLEQQDSGSVLIGDAIVDELRPSRRDLAMVFQSYALYPHLSVQDNIAVPLRMRRLSALQRLPFVGRFVPGRGRIDQAIIDNVREVTETLNISHLLERKPAQLSGGQRQRVAVGRAMVRDPAAFLMDEPLSNLDAKLRVQMRAEFAQLHRRLGSTFIYVTHDQAEAMTMSDRIVVMMSGEALQVAAPGEVYNDPLDIRVAEFIGSPKINIFPGEVVDHKTLDVLGALVPFPSTLARGSHVKAAVRPEALALRGRTHDGPKGRIELLENLGPEVLVHVRVLGMDDPVIAKLDVQQATGLFIDDGVSVAWSPDAFLLFDDAGKRVSRRDHVHLVEGGRHA